MATRKKSKKVKAKRAASSWMTCCYMQTDTYIAVVVSIILAIIVITFLACAIVKNSNMEISTRGYAKVTKFYRHYPSMRRDIRKALRDKKITYREFGELKDKYSETAKRVMR